jgi:hypothetical protein
MLYSTKNMTMETIMRTAPGADAIVIVMSTQYPVNGEQMSADGAQVEENE